MEFLLFYIEYQVVFIVTIAILVKLLFIHPSTYSRILQFDSELVSDMKVFLTVILGILLVIYTVVEFNMILRFNTYKSISTHFGIPMEKMRLLDYDFADKIKVHDEKSFKDLMVNP